MRYEKIVAGIGLGIVCFVVVAALGCIVYEVVKAHGNSPRRLQTRRPI
jgi:hypothetical protein